MRIKKLLKTFLNRGERDKICEKSGCDITVYTSDKMKAFLDKIEPGFQVIEPNTGETGTILSEKFIVCGNYCVRVKFPSGEDVYDCDFFINE